MEDYGLKYSIGFDVETGAKTAEEKLKAYNEKWDKLLSASRVQLPIDVNTDGINNFMSELDKVKEKMSETSGKFREMSMDDILSKTPESLMEASELMDELSDRRKKLKISDEEYLTVLGSINKRFNEIKESAKDALDVNVNRDTFTRVYLDELKRIKEDVARVKLEFSQLSLDELLRVDPSSLRDAGNLMKELSARREQLSTSDSNYNSTLIEINKRQLELNTSISESKRLGVEKTKSTKEEAEAAANLAKNMDDLKRKSNSLNVEISNAISRMSDRLKQIKDERNQIEEILGNMSSGKGDSRIDTDMLQMTATLENLNAEARELEYMFNAVSQVRLGQIPADIQEINKRMNETNADLLLMRDYYKGVNIENKKLIESTREKITDSGVFGMDEGDIESIRQKLGGLFQLAREVRTDLREAGFDEKAITTQVKKITTEIDRLKGRLSSLKGSFSAMSTDKLISTEPKSLSEINDLISELNKRKMNLNITSSNYAETVRRITDRQNELSRKSRELLGVQVQSVTNTNREISALKEKENIMRNLSQIATNYISIYAAWRIGNEIAMTTGEFEKQRRALTAIIKDATIAERIFGQVKDLSVKSPFEFKDLISYTKQLSAYQIQSDELYDTMKRLADASSGLGVDMNRLILAYGQVNAASVLRGQELRQFTEAGIPLVQMLADKFTLLERRVVSTGDVFDRISNRAVSFEMVRDILQDLTNEGGIFYNMQEMQADTLAGKISNLKDAFAIMYDEIGSNPAVFSALNGIVWLITSAAENWELFSAAVLFSVGTFGKFNTLTTAISTTFSGIVSSGFIHSKTLAGMNVMQSRLEASEARSATIAASKVRLAQSVYGYKAMENTVDQLGLKLDISRAEKYKIRAILAKQELTTSNMHNVSNEIKNVLISKGVTATQAQLIANEMVNASLGRSIGFWKGIGLAMKTAVVSNPFGALITALSILIPTIYSAYTALQNFREKQEKFNNAMREAKDGSEKSERQLRYYVNTIRSATSSTVEKAEALGKLNSEYREFLGGVELTIDAINKSTFSIDGYIKKLREKALAEAASKLTDESYVDMAHSQEKAAKTLADALSKVGVSQKTARLEAMKFLSEYGDSNVSSKNMYSLADSLLKVVGASDDVKKTSDNWYVLATAILSSSSAWKEASTTFKKNVKDIQDASETYGGVSGQHASMLLDSLKKTIEDNTSEIKRGIGKNGIRFDEDLVSFNERKLKSQLDDIGNFIIKHLPKVSKGDIEGILSGNLQLGGATGSIYNQFFKNYTGQVKSGIEKDFQNIFIDAMKGVQGTDVFDSLAQKDGESVKNYVQRAFEEYGKLKKRSEEVERAIANGYTKSSDSRFGTLSKEKQFLDKSMQIAKAVYEMDGLTDEKNKKNKDSGKDPRITALEEQMRIIEEAKKKYDELNKAGIASSESLKIIEKLYGGLVDKGKGFKLAVSNDQLIQQYTQYKAQLGKLMSSDPKTVKSLIHTVDIKINDKEVETRVDSIKNRLERIKSEFEENKSRIDLFNSIFDTTGSYDIADKVSTFFTGDGVDTMQENISTALRKSFEVVGADSKVLYDELGNLNTKYANDFLKKQIEANGNVKSEQVKNAQDMLKVATEFEQKHVVELLKGLKEGESIEKKRTDIMRLAAERRIEIQRMAISDSDKANLTNQANTAEKKELNKLRAEQFKGSELWQKVFGNLDNISYDSIKLLRDRIKEFMETAGKDLDPTNMREMIKSLEDMESRLGTLGSTSFKDLFKTIFSTVDTTEFEDAVESARNRYLLATADVKKYADELASARKRQEDIAKSSSSTEEERTEAADAVKEAQNNLNEATDRATEANDKLTKSEEKLIEAQNKKKKSLNDTKGQMTKLQDAFGDIVSGVEDVANSFFELSEAMGISVSEETKDIVNGFVDGLKAAVTVIGVIIGLLTTVVAVMTLIDILGAPIMITMAAIAASIAVVVATVKIFKAIRLSKFNSEIREQAKLIEKLKEDYDNLIFAAKKLVSSDWLKNYNSQIENLNAQIKATQKQLEAEKKKGKDKDKDKVKEYEESIKKSQQTLIDKQSELQAAILGTDLTSSAKSFAESWLEAYNSFGSTSEALQNKFREMMRSMVTNMMLSKVMEIALRPVFDMMEELSKDGEITADDAKKIASEGEKAIANGNAGASLIMDALGSFGDSLRDTASNLTGVSKGISGITEDTALLLGGFLNSIRYKLFEYIDWQMATETYDFSGGFGGIISAINSQMAILNGIKSDTALIAQNTSTLIEKLDRVTSPSGSRGAFSLNVNV